MWKLHPNVNFKHIIIAIPFQIFSICAFYATSDFVATMEVACHEGNIHKTDTYLLEYPFEFAEKICPKRSNKNETYLMTGDFSSDAQFFVLTGVLSMCYAVFIILVYVYLDSMYKAKPEFAMAVSIKYQIY